MDMNEIKFKSGIFLSFSGNCEQAFHFYQRCLGGEVSFQFFEQPLDGFPNKPVIIGSLKSPYIQLYGSDLMQSSGRALGNSISIILQCSSHIIRVQLWRFLRNQKDASLKKEFKNQKLIEVIDPFGIRWILAHK